MILLRFSCDPTVAECSVLRADLEKHMLYSTMWWKVTLGQKHMLRVIRSDVGRWSAAVYFFHIGSIRAFLDNSAWEIAHTHTPQCSILHLASKLTQFPHQSPSAKLHRVHRMSIHTIVKLVIKQRFTLRSTALFFKRWTRLPLQTYGMCFLLILLVFPTSLTPCHNSPSGMSLPQRVWAQVQLCVCCISLAQYQMVIAGSTGNQLVRWLKGPPWEVFSSQRKEKEARWRCKG